MQLTGAQALIKALECQGTEVIFGLPGGAILPVYDPILDSSIRHILVRHEQGAGHMAEGYALATGRPGVAMVTSGPGATNIVTPLANAYMDSTPLVVITGQVSTAAIGTDAFQECDITGVTSGITKHNWLVTDPADLPRIVAEAFYVATTGRPGPVLIDVPKDISQSMMEWYWPEGTDDLDLPGYRPPTTVDPAVITEAIRMIGEAERPVLYVGGGVLQGNASAALFALAERTGAPVVTTLMARGAFPDSHPLHLGMPGMHGTVAAVTGLQKADLLITLGARFDDRVTGKLSTFAQNAKVIHADIDPAEIGKNRYADVAVIGDVRETIKALIPALTAALAKSRADISPWLASMNKLKATYPLGYDTPADGALSPQYVIERLGKICGPDTIFTSGVGQHQMWAAQFISYEKP
ncbi:MAG: biosynthetic-type acetolactate synthase large subunit, partial [Actinomycetota bacterium]